MQNDSVHLDGGKPESADAPQSNDSVATQIKQHGELLARVVWQLNKAGYIQTYEQAEEEQCDTLLGMAMQCVEAIRSLQSGINNLELTKK